MPMPSFAFGAGFEAKTPEQVARNRAVYQAMVARGGTAPTNLGQGLNRVGETIAALAARQQADQGETAGRDQVAQVLSGFSDGADQTEILGALSNPWVASDPAGSAVAQTLLQRQYQKDDPAYQADLAYKLAQTDALKAKPANTAPSVVELFDETTGQPYKAEWNAQTGTYEKIGGTKAPADGMQIITNPDGTTSISMGGGGLPKLTEGQSKDAFYFIRGAGANENLTANETSLTGLGDTVANGVPLIGNFFTSDGFKNANRDGKEFLAAILRKDSGGAITPDEWSYYGPMYLPAPGDNPEQLANKRDARTRAMDALKAVSGPGQVIIDEYLKQHPSTAAPAAVVPPGAPAALPEGVTEEDIQFTMQKHGLTREEVLKRLTSAP